jgi:hypothetical protein
MLEDSSLKPGDPSPLEPQVAQGIHVVRVDPHAVIEVASAGSSTTNDPSGTDRGTTTGP